jgi:hypothetical protein
MPERTLQALVLRQVPAPQQLAAAWYWARGRMALRTLLGGYR